MSSGMTCGMICVVGTKRLPYETGNWIEHGDFFGPFVGAILYLGTIDNLLI
jgi:hypothetical protein